MNEYNEKNNLTPVLAIVGGAALGLGIAYQLSSDEGKRRGRKLFDKAKSYGELFTEETGKRVDVHPNDQGALNLGLLLLGGALALFGLRRHDGTGTAAMTLGIALLGKSSPRVRSIVKSPLVAHTVPALKGWAAGKRNPGR
ncbi:MAG: hypothetical protein SFV54_21255 [Bryobacteraceae bacterium]|nr:hypothetical protein [Bryobacteraceae bacterium]